MDRILCATDLSSRAELAIDRAVALTRSFDANLRVLHIVDEDQPGDMVDMEMERARARLNARIAGFRGAPVRAEAETRAGSVFQSIIEAAREWETDLIVLGAHRRRILRDVIVGTTIERVIRTGRLPVLMVNTATFVPYESVLMALDTSEASAHALNTAHSLGLLTDVNVTVVHAFEPFYKGMLGWAGVREEAIDQYTAAWAEDAGGEIRRFLRERGYNAKSMDIVLEEGPPFHSIKRTVERLHPHLLVMGTHGRTGVSRALLGSVAQRSISEIECDILTVPPSST
jgi:universal stress protein E